MSRRRRWVDEELGLGLGVGRCGWWYVGIRDGGVSVGSLRCESVVVSRRGGLVFEWLGRLSCGWMVVDMTTLLLVPWNEQLQDTRGLVLQFQALPRGYTEAVARCPLSAEDMTLQSIFVERDIPYLDSRPVGGVLGWYVLAVLQYVGTFKCLPARAIGKPAALCYARLRCKNATVSSTFPIFTFFLPSEM